MTQIWSTFYLTCSLQLKCWRFYLFPYLFIDLLLNFKYIIIIIIIIIFIIIIIIITFFLYFRSFFILFFEEGVNKLVKNHLMKLLLDVYRVNNTSKLFSTAFF